MSKLSQQDVNKLKTLVKRLAITNPVEQALVDDANLGIELFGATKKFQQVLHRQARALSHLEQALSFIEEEYFTLTIKEVPRHCKIAVLKVVRSLTKWGLKEAKEAIESTPYLLYDRLPSEKTAQMVMQLERAGAIVEVTVSM